MLPTSPRSWLLLGRFTPSLLYLTTPSMLNFHVIYTPSQTISLGLLPTCFLSTCIFQYASVRLEFKLIHNSAFGYGLSYGFVPNF